MSLRRTAYVACKPTNWAKNAKWPFRAKNALFSKEVCYKVYVNTVSGEVVSRSLCDSSATSYSLTM